MKQTLIALLARCKFEEMGMCVTTHYYIRRCASRGKYISDLEARCGIRIDLDVSHEHYRFFVCTLRLPMTSASYCRRLLDGDTWSRR